MISGEHMIDGYYNLKKEDLKNLLKAVIKDFRLISPQPANGADFLFQETEDSGKINLNYDITSNTLKEFFFPARETVFEYEKRKDGSVETVPGADTFKGETVFLGPRSCDIRAVYFQDCFFGKEPKDSLYWRKRDKSILISFACNKPPRKGCFCVYTNNSGPVLEKGEGFDLQFIDLAGFYLVEVGTGKGKNFIKKYGKLFKQSDEKILAKKSCIKESCLKHFEKEYNIMDIYEKLKDINLEKLWEELGKRCTNCGGCEFICPTCFCFYTQDIEHSKGKGERIRAWDSCIFSGYSRMAGGVNPHEKNSDRISRRFFCKLYNCYKWFGVFGCTGCGRCSFVCPVNLDMESFIASLMKTDRYQPLLKEL